MKTGTGPRFNVALRSIISRVAKTGPRLRCVATAALLCTVLPAQAQLPVTRIGAVFPPGAKVATEVEVTIAAGSDLEGVDRLWFSDPGISATQKTQAVDGQPQPQPVANQFIVRVAPEVPIGWHEVRAVGPYGISNPRAFLVGDLPEAVEAEPNNAAEQATAISAGTTVNGRADAALDIDWFRLPLVAGQRVLLDVWAERIDSRIDATIELFDARGRRLAVSHDSTQRDPLVDFTATEAGDYLLKVYDFQFAGGAEHFYRLTASAGPHLDLAIPSAVARSGAHSITLFGRMLPGGSPVEGYVAEGQLLEQMTQDLGAAGTDIPELAWQSPVRPAAAWMNGFAYRMNGPQGASNPLGLATTGAVIAVEQEPNDEPARAQSLVPPADVTGTLARRGDRDWFSFEAAEGATYAIEVFSQRLGAAVNPFLVVEQITRDAEGKEQTKRLNEVGIDSGGNVGTVSFETTTDDPSLLFTAPAKGTYRVMVRNLFGGAHTDARHFYRLSIQPPEPSFAVVAFPEFPTDPANVAQPWSLLLRKGGSARVRVVAFRREGFAGEIEIRAENLPDGWKCGGLVLHAGRSTGYVVIAANESASDLVASLDLRARAKIGDATIEHPVRPATVVWPGDPAVPAPARLARSQMVAVAGTAPYSFGHEQARTVLYQSQQILVPFTAQRRGDFAGALAITALELPDKVTADALTIAPDQTQGALRLFAPNDAAVGTFSVYAQSVTQVPFTKKPDGSDKQNVGVIDFAQPLVLEIRPGPIVLAPAPAAGGVVKQGQSLEVPVALTRRNEFAGPVTLDLVAPPGVAGLSAAEVTIAADAAQATLVVQAAADATVGKHPLVLVRARVALGESMVELHQPVALEVQP